MHEPYGIPLAIDERTGATLWPREHYPSADHALEAYWLHVNPWDLIWARDERVRLVWAWQADPEQEPGWWMWRDGIGETPPHIECVEEPKR